MSPSIRRVVLCLALACLAWAGPGPLVAQGAGEARIAPDSITELRAWDAADRCHARRPASSASA